MGYETFAAMLSTAKISRLVDYGYRAWEERRMGRLAAAILCGCAPEQRSDRSIDRGMMFTAVLDIM